MQFQEVTKKDLELQKSFLHLALWTPEGEPEHDFSVLERPHIKVYYEGWGKEGDKAFFILSANNQPIGLVQCRYKPSKPQNLPNFPEIAISVLPEYRGKGVAAALMQHLINHQGELILGVHPKNIAAITLYKKFGFEHYGIGEGGYLQMVRMNMKVQEANLALSDMLAVYAKACFDAGIVKYASAIENPTEYLTELINKVDAKPDLVNDELPTKTYFCLLDGQILGAIRVRKGSTPRIESAIGHIGYETKPSARNHGVASFLVNWVKRNALDSAVIVTCSHDNLASKKVIERCGGVYLDDYVDPEKGKVNRYQLSPSS